MSSKNFKSIKDFGNPRKSERRKYLETMMADMGLTSLNELSQEERLRWLKAVTPSPEVEKKLKEMGYSMNSDTNKRSLGSRRSKISGFYKVANLAQASSELTVSIQYFRAQLAPATSYELIKLFTTSKLQSNTFNRDALKTEIENVIKTHEADEENPEMTSEIVLNDLIYSFSQ